MSDQETVQYLDRDAATEICLREGFGPARSREAIDRAAAPSQGYRYELGHLRIRYYPNRRSWTVYAPALPGGMGQQQAVIELERLGYGRDAAWAATGRARDGSATSGGHDGTWTIGRHAVVFGTGGFRIEQAPESPRSLSPDAAIRLLKKLDYGPDAARTAIETAVALPGETAHLGRHQVRFTGGEFIITECTPLVLPGNSGTGAGEWLGILDGILHRIAAADRWLDESAPPEYRDNPLANMWRRISAGPVSEAAEAVDAANGMTGGNPRKGTTHSRADLLGELADTAVSSLLAIQSQVKDERETWRIFLAALGKVYGRVPEEYK